MDPGAYLVQKAPHREQRNSLARPRRADLKALGVAPIPSSSRGWIHGLDNDRFIKLVADAGILIGATYAGPADGEVLGTLAVAVHAQVPVAMLSQMIYA